MQHGFAARGARVDVGAVLQQPFDLLAVTFLDRRMQRAFAPVRCGHRGSQDAERALHTAQSVLKSLNAYHL